ncbi:MAG: hypothetical protein ACXW1Q_07355, partial [Halobacteriota archaeon]
FYYALYHRHRLPLRVGIFFKRALLDVNQYFGGDLVIFGAFYTLLVELAEITLRYHRRHNPSAS